MPRPASDRRKPHAPPEHPSLSDRMDRMESRFDKVESVLDQLASRLLDGDARRPEPAPRPVALPVTHDSDSDSWETGLSKEMRDALRRLPQPRLQRKDRNIAPRQRYTVRSSVKSAAQTDALRSLTPAAVQVIIFIAQHPRTTVPEIAAGTGLRPKTVNNLISVLRRHELLDE